MNRIIIKAKSLARITPFLTNRMVLRQCMSTKKPVQEIPKSFFEQFTKPIFTQLSNRSLIVVAGPETQKFLQGVTSNNISQLYNDSEDIKQKKIALYTLFLNPKGKVITDAIIIRPIKYENGVAVSAANQLWIDVSNQTITSLYEHLQRYTWKKKVNLINLRFDDQRPQLHAGYMQTIVSLTRQMQGYDAMREKAGRILSMKSSKDKSDGEVLEEGYQNMIFYDPRATRMGVRMICGANSFSFKGEMKKQGVQTYQKMNRMSGITSSLLMKNKLPFMFNSDLFNGFSFNKGCYLGQEIVARAYFTGIVRRRVFPFVLENQNERIPQGQIIYGEDKMQLGKVLQSFDGYGTVLVPYLPLMQKKWPIPIQSPSKGILQIPFGQQLKDYLSDMKQKQAKLQQIDL